MHYARDSVSPWAFFLPIALAVLVGQLLADWIGHAVRPDTVTDAPAVVAVPAEPDTPSAAPPVDVVPPLPAPVLEPAPAPVPEVATVNPDAAELAGPDRDAGVVAPIVQAEAESDGLRRLPGPISARQSGAGESCINSTVAIRSANGWEQSLENDAPVRCSATSQ